MMSNGASVNPPDMFGKPNVANAPAEVDEALHTSAGLRSLHKRFHALADRLPGWRGRRLRDVPPVVLLDAVGLTLMEDTSETRQDWSGQQRRVKKNVFRMLAWGLCWLRSSLLYEFPQLRIHYRFTRRFNRPAHRSP
jgi:hypothetical protein